MRQPSIWLAALVVVACAGCRTLEPRIARNLDAPSYAATDPAQIRVLDAVPADAVVLGDVDGVGAGWEALPGSLVTLAADLPPEIVKPSRGLYRHARYAELEMVKRAADANGACEEVATQRLVEEAAAGPKVSESAFYAPFADWLMNEVEE